MKQITIFGIALTTVVIGCGGIPKEINPEQIEQSNKLAVVTILDKDEMKIIGQSGINAFALYNLGALGNLISRLDKKITNASLGGNANLLKEIVKNMPVLQLFNEYFEAGFDVDIETIYPKEMNSLNLDFKEFKRGQGLPPRRARNDYRKLKKELDVDLVLEIKFIYGLAAYGGGVKPTAAVSALVRVIETGKNKIIMMKDIRSDALYREGHTVDEFLLNGAGMFESELIAAIKGFTNLVAKEFGVELSLKHKSFWNPEE